MVGRHESQLSRPYQGRSAFWQCSLPSPGDWQPEAADSHFCLPGDEDFSRQYTLARYGEQPVPLKKASEVVKPRSIGWLVHSYFEYMEQRVKARLSSAKTLKKKRNLLARLIEDPDRIMLIPQPKLIEMQDKMASTPAQADAFIEAISVMYEWAIKRGHLKTNPAKGIDRIYKKATGPRLEIR